MCAHGCEGGGAVSLQTLPEPHGTTTDITTMTLQGTHCGNCFSPESWRLEPAQYNTQHKHLQQHQNARGPLVEILLPDSSQNNKSLQLCIIRLQYKIFVNFGLDENL